MAHQTFYIDIDEEITSIVDRLRGARAKEIVMVVPKRALLIQSIVNLRILKKEADEAGFQLMIVTQDRLGKMLIEKAGIFVQQKMDNIADDEIGIQEEKIADDEEITSRLKEEKDANVRTRDIGSDSYFSQEEEPIVKSAKRPRPAKKEADIEGMGDEPVKEKVVNRELVTGIGSDIRKKQSQMKSSFDLVGTPPKEEKRKEDLPIRSGKIVVPESGSKKRIPGNAPKNFPEFPEEDGSSRDSEDKKIKNFFFGNDEEMKRPKKKDPEKDYKLSGDSHKWLWIFGLLSAVIVAGVLAYMFIPRVEVALRMKTILRSIDSEITGETSASESDFESEIIPARLVEVESEIARTVDATGKKTVSNQKARGRITVYNEYSSSPQPLVATTRFLSQDGKLFRLASGVTVPGMSQNGERGEIEAEVVADQSGEEYNIGPTRFTIPGFENSGNEKYNKFYAESKADMKGGGSGTAESKFITEQDISKAKTDIIKALDDSIREKIRESAGEEILILDGAIAKEEPVYKLSNSAEDVVDSFEITSGTKAKALVVSQDDLKEMTARMIERSGNGENIDLKSVKFDFGKPNVDFDTGTIDIKFHASGEIDPNVDLEAIKGEILGKDEDGLKEYLGGYKDIEKIEIMYWPPFMDGRIPFRASQVELTLDKERD